MQTRTILAGIALFIISALVWAQQHKPAAIVGVNWQAAPSTSISEGSMAWFFDPAQNRVLVCRSTAAQPAPVCQAGDLQAMK